MALCEDPSVLGTPFYVMEHVKGRIFNDPSLPSLLPDQRAAVYQVSGPGGGSGGWAATGAHECISVLPSLPQS